MPPNREQVIIEATGTATKILGSGTAATSTVGFWQIIEAQQQPIFMVFALIGVILTCLTYRMNRKYQCLRNEREDKKFNEEMAVLKYQKEELKKRRVND